MLRLYRLTRSADPTAAEPRTSAERFVRGEPPMFRTQSGRTAALMRLVPLALVALSLLVAACNNGSGSTGY